MAGVTTSANVGAYPVPLGPVLRRAPVTLQKKKRKIKKV